jgi:PEP-CTERM motif
MRQVGMAIVAVAALISFGAPVAQAASTCKWIHDMCPDYPKHDHATVGAEPVRQTSVPEPASLLLLGAGVTAAGAAVARRRKGKKDE